MWAVKLAQQQLTAGWISPLWWPTTVTGRQNQKRHGKNKIPHGKTKNLTAKPNTSQQKQNSFGFAVGICFCREVFGFCCEVFVFVVRSLVLPWSVYHRVAGGTLLISLSTKPNVVMIHRKVRGHSQSDKCIHKLSA